MKEYELNIIVKEDVIDKLLGKCEVRWDQEIENNKLYALNTIGNLVMIEYRKLIKNKEKEALKHAIERLENILNVSLDVFENYKLQKTIKQLENMKNNLRND